MYAGWRARSGPELAAARPSVDADVLLRARSMWGSNYGGGGAEGAVVLRAGEIWSPWCCVARSAGSPSGGHGFAAVSVVRVGDML